MVPARAVLMGASSQRAVVHLLSNGFAWAAPVTSIPPGKVPENVAAAKSVPRCQAERNKYASAESVPGPAPNLKPDV
jgi:hypothetical protein